MLYLIRTLKKSLEGVDGAVDHLYFLVKTYGLWGSMCQDLGRLANSDLSFVESERLSSSLCCDNCVFANLCQN